MMKLFILCLVLILAIGFMTAHRASVKGDRPLLIAHRGASGYAPEHTLAAYRLAIEQGADFIEQDLHMTRDGALVCLHDPDLARTTNVEEVFPDRATSRDIKSEGQARRGWYVVDFTLAEVKRLDAGSWFNRSNPFAANPSYAAERVPTLQEAIRLVGTRAGLYIEIKNYSFYKSMGFDMAERLARTLDEGGFKSAPGRVFIQSFSKAGLLRMREVAPHYARVQLLPMEDSGREEATSQISEELAREIAQYARGVGPSKSMLRSRDDVAMLQRAGLLVHPYTFRGATTAVQRRPLDDEVSSGATLRQAMMEEMIRFIGFGIEGGFTDYPPVWREAVKLLSEKHAR